MTKSGAATAATGLQQKAVLRGLRSSFSADRQKSRQDALHSSGHAGGPRERCDGIREESMFEVRLLGATPWPAAVEIPKKREAWQLPVFFFFRMPPFMSKTLTTARTAKAVCKRLSKF